MNTTSITQLFGITYPIIQAGMVWCSGWKLAAAVSNSGGLGLIGAGSMPPELLREHIRQCKQATDKPFGVNVPLLYARIQETIQVIIDEGVKIVFTSAGSPKTWTPLLKQHGITVVHVVSSVKFAIKSQEAGVDAVVAEGFEAGGHNGREETTTLCLIPAVVDALQIPVIAAGGIASGRAIFAMLALGAAGVQIGTLFAATVESSAHQAFKDKIVSLQEGETELVMKQLTPVRLVKNPFWEKVKEAESNGASPEILTDLLGKGRAKKGIFEGDWQEGEWEVGQVAMQIQAVRTVAEVMHDLVTELETTKKRLYA
jgi:enoyl-[acyl-carrier protein] reductase II